jgi:hypothetical protein
LREEINEEEGIKKDFEGVSQGSHQDHAAEGKRRRKQREFKNIIDLIYN